MLHGANIVKGEVLVAVDSARLPTQVQIAVGYGQTLKQIRKRAIEYRAAPMHQHMARSRHDVTYLLKGPRQNPEIRPNIYLHPSNLTFAEREKCPNLFFRGLSEGRLRDSIHRSFIPDPSDGSLDFLLHSFN